MKADLAAEMFAASSRVRQIHLDHLFALGVPVAALAWLGSVQPAFGVARARLGGDGSFEPDPDGVSVIVQPILAAEREWGDPGILDLIAWHSSDPSRWWWRRGDGWLLGEHLLEDRGEPVACVQTPLDWLRAGGDALCLLDWAAPPQLWEALRHGPALRFTCPNLRARVQHHLTQSIRLPDLELADAA
jgi:hypothetical protein